MRLSRLEIFGFKSFLHKVEIPFGPGITAVVGPNGCGKSNIVEAIRWVMGEQRAGAVRGHRMEDVIFAGTRQRKPLGMAEVSVTIDNSNQDLPIDYSEVTITRRLFRSGESDYLLNKVPCRLLDIQNLLMDTGLGPGAYSVMEQGMVDEIISEKTENRRRILEEAAGITKYKARRRSTWSKLESTQADLTRLEDIIGEVKRQVDYLGRQVGRARRYQTIRRELDQLEALYARHSYFDLLAELQPLRHEFADLTRRSESGFTEFTAREAELEKRRLAVTDAEQALQAVGIELTRCIEEIHQRDGGLISCRERREAREQFVERHTLEREDRQRQLTATEEQRRQTVASLEQAEAELESSGSRLRERESAAAAAEREYEASRAGLDGENRRLRDLLREKGELNSGLQRLHAEREALERARQQVAEELRRLETSRLAEESRRSEAEADSRRLQERTATVDGDLLAARQRLTEAEAALATLAEARAEGSRAIQSDEARIHVLERVRSGYEGYSGGVRTLMVDSPYQDLFLGVLGDLIDVEPRYRRAVETALGDSIEALVAASDAGILEAIRYLEEHSGRAGIYPLSWQTQGSPPGAEADLAALPGVVGPLARYVRSDAAIAPLVARLLHNTFLVEDIGAALAAAPAHLGEGVRLVSPNGEGIDVDGRVAGGHVSADDASVLGRGQEIRDLRAGAARQRARLATLEHGARGLETRRGVLRRYIARLEALLAELRDQAREAGLRAREAQAGIERLSRTGQEQQRRQAEAEARFGQLEEGARADQERLAAIDEDAVALEARLREREASVQRAERARREQLEALNALRVERARAAEQTDSRRRDAERLAHLERSHRENIERLEAELTEAVGDRERLVEREAAIAAEIAAMHQERERLQADRNDKQERYQDVLVRSRELEEEISRLQRELGAQREKRHQLELRIAELENGTRHIRERLQAEHHMDVESLGPLEDETFDGTAAAEQLQRLRQAIERLGAVHVGVLEEYEEQKERYDFLVQQRDDLQAAAEDLRKTLQLIDRTARRMFRETFEEIRERFRQTFIRFFPGGEADLILQAEVDPLESTIEITARPRGKRLQSIGLLSGGERALTAIALLFAIYQVKPSPFCILDEVDAPLDDANVDRFLLVLQEFAKHTQFIMVTHNKISMAASDTLHGVTMPEEGVSQLVSVQMDEEVLEEAAG
ncbi:MAG: chromosome segregation protein SMC [Gemmatimonadota bacterium]